VAGSDRNRELYLELVEGRPVVDARFRNIRRIGASGGDGHFSLLFSADDDEAGTTIALKVFRPDRRDDAYRVACFEREAGLLGKLKGQPDIIASVLGKSEFTETLTSTEGIRFDLTFSYYGMELAQSDVAKAIAERAWDAEASLLGFRAMCRAVQRIHARNIVHRDLKPGNFLIMRNGDVKLGDFGTARYIDTASPALLPMYGAPVGDMRFAAPEVVAGLHDNDPSMHVLADIWSLGAILFQLFTRTTLSLQIFDPGFQRDLLQAMGAVAPQERRRVYDRFAGQMADGHPLPSVSEFGADTPACVRERIDDLCRLTAALDYRKRLSDFQTIFHKVNACLLILRHEEKYRRWRESRRRRMDARSASRTPEVRS
jgi:serine/threonine protein kinase